MTTANQIFAQPPEVAHGHLHIASAPQLAAQRAPSCASSLIGTFYAHHKRVCPFACTASSLQGWKPCRSMPAGPRSVLLHHGSSGPAGRLRGFGNLPHLAPIDSVYILPIHAQHPHSHIPCGLRVSHLLLHRLWHLLSSPGQMTAPGQGTTGGRGTRLHSYGTYASCRVCLVDPAARAGWCVSACSSPAIPRFPHSILSCGCIHTLHLVYQVAVLRLNVLCCVRQRSSHVLC